MADLWSPTSILDAGGLSLPPGADVLLSGRDPVIDTRHHVGEVAAAAAALAAAWAARVGERRGLANQSVRVDTTAAAATLLGFLLQSCDRPIDLNRQFSPMTALYRTSDDRLIHLHGGFEHLARGAADLLGCDLDHSAIAARVATWSAPDLEAALADAGLCGAMVRTADEWAAHPQGRAVGALPAVRLTRIGDAEPPPLGGAERPLAGLRVLDLTRVLAGPTAGRTLAAHGADVLRVDCPRLPSIEVFDIETGRGKRSAFCDLENGDDRARLAALLGDADVVVQSYRRGALDRFGLDVETLARGDRAVIVAQLNCYGPDGPWADRRGWEQLAQAVSGLAHAERPDDPRLVPAAATDYTTGYLAAAGIAAALDRSAADGGSWLIEVSLGQTAAWLTRLGADLDPAHARGLGDVAARQDHRPSAWGTLTQLAPIEDMSATPPRWDTPPVPTRLVPTRLGPLRPRFRLVRRRRHAGGRRAHRRRRSPRGPDEREPVR